MQLHYYIITFQLRFHEQFEETLFKQRSVRALRSMEQRGQCEHFHMASFNRSIHFLSLIKNMVFPCCDSCASKSLIYQIFLFYTLQAKQQASPTSRPFWELEQYLSWRLVKNLLFRVIHEQSRTFCL